MTISYPLSVPSALKAATFSLTPRKINAGTASTFTGAQQIVKWASIWELTIITPPMNRDNGGASVEAFINSLDGQYGTFLFGPPHAKAIRGTANTSGVTVSAVASSGSTSLSLTGLGATTTLKAGDYFQLGSSSTTRLYQIMADVTSDSSGNATIEIRNPLRSAAAIGDTVTLASPQGLWRLKNNGVGWSVGVGGLYQAITIEAVEAL